MSYRVRRHPSLAGARYLAELRVGASVWVPERRRALCFARKRDAERAAARLLRRWLPVRPPVRLLVEPG